MKYKFLYILFALIIGFFGCTKTGNESNTSIDVPVKEEIVPVEQEFTGYLADVTCGSTGKGMDGSNLVTNPEEHTKHCLEVCAASGFGIMLKNDDGETYRFVKFDDKGNNLSNESLNMMEEGQSINITVKGYIENNIISVSNF